MGEKIKENCHVLVNSFIEIFLLKLLTSSLFSWMYNDAFMHHEGLNCEQLVHVACYRAYLNSWSMWLEDFVRSTEKKSMTSRTLVLNSNIQPHIHVSWFCQHTINKYHNNVHVCGHFMAMCSLIGYANGAHLSAIWENTALVL